MRVGWGQSLSLPPREVVDWPPAVSAASQKEGVDGRVATHALTLSDRTERSGVAVQTWAWRKGGGWGLWWTVSPLWGIDPGDRIAITLSPFWLKPFGTSLIFEPACIGASIVPRDGRVLRPPQPADRAFAAGGSAAAEGPSV